MSRTRRNYDPRNVSYCLRVMREDGIPKQLRGWDKYRVWVVKGIDGIMGDSMMSISGDKLNTWDETSGRYRRRWAKKHTASLHRQYSRKVVRMALQAHYEDQWAETQEQEQEALRASYEAHLWLVEVGALPPLRCAL